MKERASFTREMGLRLQKLRVEVRLSQKEAADEADDGRRPIRDLTRIPELKHKDTKNTKKDRVSGLFGLSPNGWSSEP